jgi:arylsulfatase A-like enzyme
MKSVPFSAPRQVRSYQAIVFLSFMVSLSVTGLVACENQESPVERPGSNLERLEYAPIAVAESPRFIVFVIIDTLRSDHVGVYGEPRGLTPNIDAIANKGVVFENAIASSSWTRSSVASMITSRYPTKIGVLGRSDAIADSLDTLAEVLQVNGFRTQAVVSNSNAGKPFGFAQGFDRFVLPESTVGYPEEVGVHPAELVTRKALELVDDLPLGESVFLYVHYQDPHDPYLPHPEFLDEREPPGRFDGSRRQLDAMDKIPRSELSDQDVARIRYLYAGEVAYCDHWIGKLFEGLEERGLMDHSLVVITSDHGEGLWDHGMRAHGQDLYEEMVRVPLILRYADRKMGGRRISTPVSHLDLAPTILAAMGIPPPASYDGIDLASVLTDASQHGRSVYSELEIDGLDLEAIRSGQSKFIRSRKSADEGEILELYDLAEDPGELRNIATSVNPATEGFVTKLSNWLARQQANRVRSPYVNLSALDSDAYRNLQVLGYITPDDPRELLPVLDFGHSAGPAEQLINGFFPHARSRRWIADRASVLLGRSAGERTWQIRGWIDLDLHGVDRLSISVSANGAPPITRSVKDTGFFVLEGQLPDDAQKTVRLDFECDHAFSPSGEESSAKSRRLCVVVQGVGVF